VFAPLNVNSPVPAFVKLPLPLTTPFQFTVTGLGTVTVEFAVMAPDPPNVSAPLFVASPSVTLAPIENAFPTVRAVTESLETTLAALIVSVPVPNAASFPMRKVPLDIVTPPENVFAAPNVSTEAPPFVNWNAPPKDPLKITGLKTVNVALEPSVPAPEKVNEPV
jgi:hypothetical protein